MIDDYEVIVHDTPRDFPYINLYFLHDVHIGNPMFEQKRFEAFLKLIEDDPFSRVVIIGDMMETVIQGSKGDIFRSTSPMEQKELCYNYLNPIRHKICAVTGGNHENRITRETSLMPLYDVCCRLGIEDNYRPHFLFVDFGVGTNTHDHKFPVRYTMFATHKAKDQKNFSTADMVDGVDVFAFGHDHSPIDHPRGRLYYDRQHQSLHRRSVETINAGSFLRYGEYAADAAYRIPSDKLYSVRLHGGRKRIETTGFYL